jgi:transcriptional regulator with XRE-family HTH domain
VSDDVVGRGRTVGKTIRLARLASHQSQGQLGARLGYSASAISRIESGKRTLDVATLRSIAAVLHIPPEHLGLVGRDRPPPDTSNAPRRQHSVIPAARLSATPRRDGDDPVERRDFLTAVAGAAAGTLGVPGAAEAAAQETPFGRLDRVLFADAHPELPPVGAAQLRARLAAARADFRAGRYAALGEGLPDLIVLGQAGRAAARGSAREAAVAVLADTFSLATEWCVKQNQDPLAWVTADRALRAARECGRPTAVGEAARMAAIAMRRAGHYDAASDLLTSAALTLGADSGDPDPDTLGVYGSLLLTASYTAAQGGKRATALDLAGEAEQAAHRMRRPASGGVFSPDFTADQVALYRIGVHHALGDDIGALRHARTIDVGRLPTAERRARFCLDVARAHQSLGNPDKAYQALLAAERHAPEDVRRPSVRTVVGELLYAPGAMQGLRSFARRIGAAP